MHVVGKNWGFVVEGEKKDREEVDGE